MARSRPSRVSGAKVLRELRAAARKGDRSALTLALAEMRTLALSPRYWEKYLVLLGNPLARLVDLLVIKQGERIAFQKGWKRPGGGLRPPSSSKRLAPAASPTSSGKGAGGRSSKRRPGAGRQTPPEQQSLFDL